jgi:hypothetical protein
VEAVEKSKKEDGLEDWGEGINKRERKRGGRS